MRILLIESDAVIEGEQLVGALADLGVNPSTFEWELSKLDAGDFHMHFEREEGTGRAGVAFTIHPGATHQEHHHQHGHAEHHQEHPHSHAPAHHDASEEPAPQREEHAHRHEHLGAEDGPASPCPALNVSALRQLVESSDLSARSKTLSLGLLADLEGIAQADRSLNRRSGAGGLSEAQLSLLAQVVLVSVGIDQLRIDQVEIARTNPREHASPEINAATRAPSLDPVIAALQTRLPRTGSPAGLRRIQSGVGVSASAAGLQGARIEAFLLEG